MAERRKQDCPGTMLVCPACRRPANHFELLDAEGFFQCDRRACRAHVYVACSAYYCTTTEVTRTEREHMRTLTSATDRLAYLATRVAWEEAA
jgi:hypothetical protein